MHGYTWIQLETDTTLRIESRHDRERLSFLRDFFPFGLSNLWSAISAGGCEGSKISNVSMISIHSRLTTYMTKQWGYNNSSGSGVWPIYMATDLCSTVNTGRLYTWFWFWNIQEATSFVYLCAYKFICNILSICPLRSPRKSKKQMLPHGWVNLAGMFDMF